MFKPEALKQSFTHRYGEMQEDIGKGPPAHPPTSDSDRGPLPEGSPDRGIAASASDV